MTSRLEKNRQEALSDIPGEGLVVFSWLITLFRLKGGAMLVLQYLRNTHQDMNHFVYNTFRGHMNTFKTLQPPLEVWDTKKHQISFEWKREWKWSKKSHKSPAELLFLLFSVSAWRYLYTGHNAPDVIIRSEYRVMVQASFLRPIVVEARAFPMLRTIRWHRCLFGIFYVRPCPQVLLRLWSCGFHPYVFLWTGLLENGLWR